MTLEFGESGRPLAEIDIERVERRFGFALPRAYREFLLRHNGGRPNLAYYPIRGFQDEFGGVKVFLRIGSDILSSDLVWVHDLMSGRLPPGQLAIANTDNGDLLCLTIGGLAEGRVMFWDHEAETVPPTFDNMYEVAPTFEEFLASLHHQDFSAEIAALLPGTKVLKKPS